MGPIGVFDSGLGGLTVLVALQEVLPRQEFVYLGDTANAPYGPRSDAEIIALTRRAVAALASRGCGLVLLACNTACAVALRDIQADEKTAAPRVIGVLVPLIEAVTGRDWADTGPPRGAVMRVIAVFATTATIESGMFQTELASRLRDTQVWGQACPGLVSAIETGGDVDRHVRAAVTALLARCPSPDLALLACTHYPLVRDLFRQALPAETRLLSQAEATATRLAAYLQRHPRFRSEGPTRYLTPVTRARWRVGPRVCWVAICRSRRWDRQIPSCAL